MSKSQNGFDFTPVYQPLGDMLFETYPWRLWLPHKWLTVERKLGIANLTIKDHELYDNINRALSDSGIEYRTFQFPHPNIRFRTEQDALFFILRFSNEA